jgi:transposase
MLMDVAAVAKIWRRFGENSKNGSTKANNYKNLGIIDETLIESIENQYCKILKNGLAEQPKEILPEKIKRWRKAKSKSVRLLDVFINRSHQILMFIYNNNVPFDNNLAERDLRMVKLKQKISGCFRFENGAKVFCRIRSYNSTLRKQGFLVLDSIQLAINKAPVNISLG